MGARPNGRPVKILVAVAVCGLASLGVFAEPLEDMHALPGWVSKEERARILALTDVNELVNLLKTGVRGQKEAAVRALLAKGREDILLSTARTGPRDTSQIIIESYVPRATAESDAKKKKEVDAYVKFLEEQLRSKSPVVGPHRAVRSLARVVYWRSDEYKSHDPRVPRPAPRYQHRRVVNDLIRELKDKRLAARHAAVHWLSVVGAYDLGHAQVVRNALTAYRRAVASAPASTRDEKMYKKMALHSIDFAIKNFDRERSRRIRYGVESGKSGAKTPSTQPVSSKTRKGKESPNP